MVIWPSFTGYHGFKIFGCHSILSKEVEIGCVSISALYKLPSHPVHRNNNKRVRGFLFFLTKSNDYKSAEQHTEKGRNVDCHYVDLCNSLLLRFASLLLRFRGINAIAGSQ